MSRTLADMTGLSDAFARRRDAWAVLPVAAAATYPLLLQTLSRIVVRTHGSISPDGMALGFAVAGSLLIAFAVMASGFAAAGAIRNRVAVFLVFATPSLFVGFGNVANLLHEPAVASIGWPLFWAIIAVTLFAPAHAGAERSPGARFYRRLAIAHGITASAIVILFLALHLANHLGGLASGATHIAFMNAARQFYRNDIVEPLLVALVVFQIGSGVVLAQRRIRAGSDFFGRLQAMTGVYVAVYFLAHLTAVFGARMAGTDTDWNWLTNKDHSMLGSLSNLRLIGHYWFGPVAVLTHLGCGLRAVLREHGVRARMADMVPRVAMGAGAAVASVIVAALLGLRVA